MEDAKPEDTEVKDTEDVHDEDEMEDGGGGCRGHVLICEGHINKECGGK